MLCENDFWEAIGDWQQVLTEGKNESYDVRSIFYTFLDRCSIHVSPKDSDLMTGLGIVSQIIRSVEEVHRRRLDSLDRRSARGLISECYFALLENKKRFGESVPIESGIDAITVSTVHQAKGLEWPIVVIPNLIEKRFPVKSSAHGSNFSDKIAKRYGTSVEDERRLFYVAITRARERLILVDFKGKNRTTSRFLTELNPTYIKPKKSLSQLPERFWKLNKRDIKDQDPPPLRIGLSDLLLFLECPYQYGLRRIVLIQPSVGEELGYGKSLHDLIRRRFECGDAWSKSELIQQADEHVFMPLVSKEQENTSRKTIVERVHMLDEINAFTNKSKPEIPINIELEGGIISGIVDCIQEDNEGNVIIRDWKSSIHEAFLPRYENQMKFYRFALEQSGIKVIKAEIVDISASFKQFKLVSRIIDISNEKASLFVSELKQAITGIRKRDYPAKASYAACSCCDVYKLCGQRYEIEKVN